MQNMDIPGNNVISNFSNLRYTGAHLDCITAGYALGNGYRVYIPTIMRFSAPDSLSPFGPGGLNPYVYCGDDPINRADPSGHIPVGITEEVAEETSRIEEHTPSESIAARQAAGAPTHAQASATSAAAASSSNAQTLLAHPSASHPIGGQGGARPKPRPAPLTALSTTLSEDAAATRTEAFERAVDDVGEQVKQMQRQWRGRWGGTQPPLGQAAAALRNSVNHLHHETYHLMPLLEKGGFTAELNRVQKLQPSVQRYSELTNELIDAINDMAERAARAARTLN